MARIFFDVWHTGMRSNARIFLFCLPAALLGSFSHASAQAIPNLNPDQLQQMQQQYLPGGQQPTAQANQQQAPVVLQPAVPAQSDVLAQSRLEQIMSARAGSTLKQFGYDQLGHPSAVMVPQTGAVQDDYVMGSGDEVAVVLRGQENNEYRATVDRNGQVTLPRLAPISALGRSFGSFRQDVQAAVHRAYVATDVSVSIARMRQISVLVTGAVNNPGQRLVTGLSSALDALLLSGGITKFGSLRDVRIIRGGRQYNVDLYSVLSGNSNSASLRLADGDRIYVAPLGRTVAIAGLVRNAGIYELPRGQASISAQALMTLAGGPEVSGNYLYSILQLQPDGRSALVRLNRLSDPVRDGEVLFLQLQADQTSSRITLSGGTPLAGNYPLMTGVKLSEIIRRPGALGASPYTLFAIISRRDPKTLLRTLVAISPAAILNGTEDQVLLPDDIVRPLSVDELHMLISTVHDYDQWRASQEEAIRHPIGSADAKPRDVPPPFSAPFVHDNVKYYGQCNPHRRRCFRGFFKLAAKCYSGFVGTRPQSR